MVTLDGDVGPLYADGFFRPPQLPQLPQLMGQE